LGSAVNGTALEDSPEMLTLVGTVMNLLVRGEYETVEGLTRGQRLSAKELENAVADYGRHLISPPRDAWNGLHVIPRRRRWLRRREFTVVVPMWTEEEGMSDLTLELRLKEAPQGLYDAEVLDLHVP